MTLLATNLRLDGCKRAYLKVDGPINTSVFDALCLIRSRGVNHVATVEGTDGAVQKKERIIQEQGSVPPTDRFLQLTKRGTIINLHL